MGCAPSSRRSTIATSSKAPVQHNKGIIAPQEQQKMIEKELKESLDKTDVQQAKTTKRPHSSKNKKKKRGSLISSSSSSSKDVHAVADCYTTNLDVETSNAHALIRIPIASEEDTKDHTSEINQPVSVLVDCFDANANVEAEHIKTDNQDENTNCVEVAVNEASEVDMNYASATDAMEPAINNGLENVDVSSYSINEIDKNTTETHNEISSDDLVDGAKNIDAESQVKDNRRKSTPSENVIVVNHSETELPADHVESETTPAASSTLNVCQEEGTLESIVEPGNVVAVDHTETELPADHVESETTQAASSTLNVCQEEGTLESIVEPGNVVAVDHTESELPADHVESETTPAASSTLNVCQEESTLESLVEPGNVVAMDHTESELPADHVESETTPAVSSTLNVCQEESTLESLVEPGNVVALDHPETELPTDHGNGPENEAFEENTGIQVKNETDVVPAEDELSEVTHSSTTDLKIEDSIIEADKSNVEEVCATDSQLSVKTFAVDSQSAVEGAENSTSVEDGNIKDTANPVEDPVDIEETTNGKVENVTESGENVVENPDQVANE